MYVNELIQFGNKRIDVLYEQSLPTIIASQTAAIILLFILWGHSEISSLVIWFGLFLLLTGVRLYGIYSYKHSSSIYDQQDIWLKRYIIGAFLSGCMWGATGFILISNIDIIYTGFITLCVCGLVAGSIPSYSIYHSVYFSFNLPAIIPLLLYLLSKNNPQYYVMALLMCFFVGFMFFIEFRTHKMILNLLKLKFDTVNLMLDLDEKQQQAISLQKKRENITSKFRYIQVEFKKAKLKIEELEAQLNLK